MGFDSDERNFFLVSYVFAGTNVPLANRVWSITSGQRNGRFVAQGQETFIGTLFSPPPSGQDKMTFLRTSNFINTYNEIYSGTVVPEQEMVDWILGILDSDQKWAIPLGFDNRPIAGPYPVIKITPEGASRLQ
jgi:hypothetical protein